MFNKNIPIPITCPTCKFKFQKTLRELEASIIKCPNGHEIKNEMAKGLKDAEDSIKRFGKKIERDFNKH